MVCMIQTIPLLKSLKACADCGSIHAMPEFRPDHRIYCARCGHQFKSASDFGAMRVRVTALTLAALLLFPAAVTLPILQIEKFGQLHRSSLVGGIHELFVAGEWGIATLIFLFSFVFPIMKLIGLLELCWLQSLPQSIRIRVYRWVETFGKWSMLDVLLLALMVMWIKLSDLVSFQFGPAALAFAACVLLSMTASLAFDPEFVWEQTV